MYMYLCVFIKKKLNVYIKLKYAKLSIFFCLQSNFVLFQFNFLCDAKTLNLFPFHLAPRNAVSPIWSTVTQAASIPTTPATFGRCSCAKHAIFSSAHSTAICDASRMIFWRRRPKCWTRSSETTTNCWHRHVDRRRITTTMTAINW